MFNADSAKIEGEGAYESEHLNMWWSLFSKHCLPSLNEETVSFDLQTIIFKLNLS